MLALCHGPICSIEIHLCNGLCRPCVSSSHRNYCRSIIVSDERLCLFGPLLPASQVHAYEEKDKYAIFSLSLWRWKLVEFYAIMILTEKTSSVCRRRMRILLAWRENENGYSWRLFVLFCFACFLCCCLLAKRCKATHRSHSSRTAIMFRHQRRKTAT